MRDTMYKKVGIAVGLVSILGIYAAIPSIKTFNVADIRLTEKIDYISIDKDLNKEKDEKTIHPNNRRNFIDIEGRAKFGRSNPMSYLKKEEKEEKSNPYESNNRDIASNPYEGSRPILRPAPPIISQSGVLDFNINDTNFNKKEIDELIYNHNKNYYKVENNNVWGYEKNSGGKVNQINISGIYKRFLEEGYSPVKQNYLVVSSPFGMRINPIIKNPDLSNSSTYRFHSGIDLATNGIFKSPVYSVLGGKIEKVERSNSGYGNLVIVDHGNFKTLYAHLDSIENIKSGDSLYAGQEIGKVGTTGNSTGPHLHFEIVVDNTAVNPKIFLEIFGLIDNKSDYPKEYVVVDNNEQKDIENKINLTPLKPLDFEKGVGGNSIDIKVIKSGGDKRCMKI